MVNFLSKNMFLPLLATAGGRNASAGSFNELDMQTRILCTLISLGLLALLGWITLRIGRRDSLSLRKTPGRPSNLGWLHVGVIGGWSVMNIAAGYFSPDKPLEPADIRAALMMQFIILVVCLASAQRSFNGGIVRGMGLSHRRWLVDSVRGILGFLMVFPICWFMVLLSRKILGSGNVHLHPLLAYLTEIKNAVDIIWPVLLAVIMAPICEEVMYRGLLQTAIKNLTGNKWAAIIIASGFFAVIHVSFSRDPFAVRGLDSVAALFALAMVMGYNYQRTGRLWSSILIHMIFNAVNIISLLMSTDDSAAQTALMNIFHLRLLNI